MNVHWSYSRHILIQCMMKYYNGKRLYVLYVLVIDQFYDIAGGAGGKGTWGKPGSELLGEGVTDEHDPNYDSEDEVSGFMAYNDCIFMVVSAPVMVV